MGRKLTNAKLTCFVEAVETAYNCNKQVYGHKESRALCRGRSKCNSGIFEDLFAGLMFDCVVGNSRHWLVLIDYPVRMSSNGKVPVTRYPDFLLCRIMSKDALKLVYMADLKTNTGYFRGQGMEMIRSMRDDVADFLSASPDLSHATVGGERYRISCASDFKYDLIIYSNVNADAKELDAQCEHVANDANDSVRMHILCDWNNHSGQVPRLHDFENIENRIKGQMMLI